MAIAWTLALQKKIGLAKDAFEFQMLYGVKPGLQAALQAAGYGVRCYVPYGGDWATHLIGCLRRIPAGTLAQLTRHIGSQPMGRPLLGNSPVPRAPTSCSPAAPGKVMADPPWRGKAAGEDQRGSP